MVFFQFLAYFLAVLASFHYFSSHLRKRRAGKLPSGPYPWPIVGNIFQLGRAPHRSLANLSKTFGPIMSLKLGKVNAIVVSSPQLAKEILQKNDLAFSGRFSPGAFQAYDHHKFAMACLSTEDKVWKKFRKICKEQLFSTHCLDASQGLRQENLQRLSDYVQKCCDGGREVKIGQAAFATMLSLMSATLFSTELAEFDSDTYQEFKETTSAIFRYLGAPNIADFFPILDPIDPQGVKRNIRHYFGKLLAIIENIINQRLKSRGTSLAYQKKNDFLETLLDLREGSEYELTSNEIKHLLADLILAGAETSSTTTEWAMTELLLNPEKLKKAKDELRTVIGKNKQVEESDISRLPYLQAVIKEVLRLYPSGPLLFPHKAVYDVEVSGYTIPKDTQALVNVWAIGRDPTLWSNPNAFEPERFLDQKTNFSGQDFKLLPFGAGRKICPGMPLANRMAPGMVATLVHNFDWKFEVSAEAEELHRGEVLELSLQKRVPLRAIPIKSQA